MAIRLIQKTMSLESDLDTPAGLFLFHDPVFLPLRRYAGKPFIQGRDMPALNPGAALYLLDASPKTDDAAGYDAAVMSAFMEQARQAAASGTGRRFADA